MTIVAVVAVVAVVAILTTLGTPTIPTTLTTPSRSPRPSRSPTRLLLPESRGEPSREFEGVGDPIDNVVHDKGQHCTYPEGKSASELQPLRVVERRSGVEELPHLRDGMGWAVGWDGMGGWMGWDGISLDWFG